MVSNINFNFAGIFKQGFEEIDVINITKAFLFYYSPYIFEPGVKASCQINNGDIIPVNDTKISVKSLIPKDKNGPVDIIAPKEYQLAHPDNNTVKCITNGTFVGQYTIKRNSPEIKKAIRNKASGKIETKSVFQVKILVDICFTVYQVIMILLVREVMNMHIGYLEWFLMITAIYSIKYIVTI
jgi:hypothetical protein